MYKERSPSVIPPEATWGWMAGWVIKKPGKKRRKRHHRAKSCPNRLRTLIFEFFGVDLGRYWGRFLKVSRLFFEGFGMVLKMILEAWRSIFRSFQGSFAETSGNNTTPQENSIPAASAASERASAASAASGAIQVLESNSLRFFGRFAETDITGKK